MRELRFFRRSVAAILCLTIGAISFASGFHQLQYKTDIATIQMLGRDLSRSAPVTEQARLSSQPLLLQNSHAPCAGLVWDQDGAEVIRGIWISAGLIDLINQVAHAKAIDRIRRGYFKRYIGLLEQSPYSIAPLPNGQDPAFWTVDLLNEQQSNFNSIVGVLVGIKLAHQYLGHYQKYRRSLGASGDTAVINNLLTPQEWDSAWRRGLESALHAGCMTEGVVPLLQALDQMKDRPAWAAHFLPDNCRFSKMRRDFLKVQRKFLRD